MKKYDRLTSHAFEHETPLINEPLMESMWELFKQIGLFWDNGNFVEDTKSQLLVFMSNRIQLNSSYLQEYENAKLVIEELIEELGVQGGYEKLFTSHVDTSKPPSTYFERARIKVSNEFVLFQLAVGGFKAYGAKNYPGYFGGANVVGKPPYRTFED